MRISFVTTYNAQDVHNWSGVGYYLSKALAEQHNQIEYAGDLDMKFRKVLKVKEFLYGALGYRYKRNREVFVARHYAAQAAKKISASSDIILSPGTIPIAYLEIDKPKVFYTDACFAGIIDFYPLYKNLPAETIRSGHAIERAALSSCSLAIYSSDWAAQSAIKNYAVSPEKVKVVPFGANIECNRTYDDIKQVIKSRSRTTCRLLFLGVDWERKGGNMAVNIMKSLNDSGLNTELHIAGISSLPFKDLPGNIVNHGYISKSSRQGRDKIQELVAQSHFLVLPTKAEFFGIVFCEASSYGVPSIATQVGGVPTVVRDNVNGKLFPLSATEVDYSKYILNLFNNYNEYEQLALSSFNEYENRLNWDVSGKKITELMQGLI